MKFEPAAHKSKGIFSAEQEWHMGPTWGPSGLPSGSYLGSQVGPTSFCPAGPLVATVGWPMCDTSGSHFTPKWVPCLHLKVGLPTLVPYGQPNCDTLHFVRLGHFGPI